MKKTTAHHTGNAGPALGRGWLRLFLIALLSFVWITSPAAYEATGQKPIVVKDSGTVTSVNNDFIFIDNKGYLFSRRSKFFDMDGKRIELDDLQIPVKVKYEFVYTQQGPVIEQMKAMGD